MAAQCRLLHDECLREQGVIYGKDQGVGLAVELGGFVFGLWQLAFVVGRAHHDFHTSAAGSGDGSEGGGQGHGLGLDALHLVGGGQLACGEEQDAVECVHTEVAIGIALHLHRRTDVRQFMFDRTALVDESADADALAQVFHAARFLVLLHAFQHLLQILVGEMQLVLLVDTYNTYFHFFLSGV